MDHLRETCKLMEPVAIKLHLTAGTFQIYCKTFWMVIRFFETVVSCSSLICHNANMNFKYITNNKITTIKSSYSTSSIPAVKIIEKKEKNSEEIHFSSKVLFEMFKF